MAAFHSTPMHDPGLKEVQRSARVCVCKGSLSATSFTSGSRVSGLVSRLTPGARGLSASRRWASGSVGRPARTIARRTPPRESGVTRRTGERNNYVGCRRFLIASYRSLFQVPSRVLRPLLTLLQRPYCSAAFGLGVACALVLGLAKPLLRVEGADREAFRSPRRGHLATKPTSEPSHYTREYTA